MNSQHAIYATPNILANAFGEADEFHRKDIVRNEIKMLQSAQLQVAQIDGQISLVYLKWILLLQIILLQWTQLMDLWSSGAMITAVIPSACSLRDMTDHALIRTLEINLDAACKPADSLILLASVKDAFTTMTIVDRASMTIEIYFRIHYPL